jgi:uncharacterized protein VirK/YbjX
MTVINVFAGTQRDLVQRTAPWTPLWLARGLWNVARGFTLQLEMLRLLKVPAYAKFARIHPKFLFRFNADDYLARGFTLAERAASFQHHYRKLQGTLPDAFLRRILYDEAFLFELQQAGCRFTITLGTSRSVNSEGELTLGFLVEGNAVFVLSFTIVPGAIAGSSASEVVLVSRLQGFKGFYPEIRKATKALHEVSPGALLVAALQGFAEAFGVSEMVGVSTTRQTAFSEGWGPEFREAYDDFFLHLGAERNAADLFVVPLPLPERPLAEVKKGHKIRTKAKRAFKQRVAGEVCEFLRSGLI